MEIDICESVLNGGWEALEQGRVDLIVGSPGPVPLQKGYRAILLVRPDLVPVIGCDHVLASLIDNPEAFKAALPKVRRVITHDTLMTDVARNAGLGSEGQTFFVQNIDQKVEAILAGIGIGHLPLERIKRLLDDGKLVKLELDQNSVYENFLAWKISNKGKGLQALTKRLSVAFG